MTNVYNIASADLNTVKMGAMMGSELLRCKVVELRLTINSGSRTYNRIYLWRFLYTQVSCQLVQMGLIHATTTKLIPFVGPVRDLEEWLQLYPTTCSPQQLHSVSSCPSVL